MGRAHPVRNAIGLLVFLALILMLMATTKSAHSNPVYYTGAPRDGSMQLFDAVQSVEARIPSAQDSKSPGTGAYPEFGEIIDVRPATGGLQILDGRKHPIYTLMAQVTKGKPQGVSFQYWNGDVWFPSVYDAMQFQGVTMDQGKTWTYNWEASLLDNRTAASADTIYWRALAWQARDSFQVEPQGNLQTAPTATNGPSSKTPVWELCTIVIDGTEPSACISQIGDDSQLVDQTTTVELGSTVPVAIRLSDNDGVAGTTDITRCMLECRRVSEDNWNLVTYRANQGLWQIAVTGDTTMVIMDWDLKRYDVGVYQVRAVAIDQEGNTSMFHSCYCTVNVVMPPRIRQ